MMEFYYREPNEEFKIVEVEKSVDTYGMLKRHVRGIIDCVNVGELDIWIDDEGLLKSLDVNLIIKRSRTNKITNNDTVIVGNVVFASTNEAGETIPLTTAAKEIMNNMKPASLGANHMIYIIEDY